MRDPLRSVTLLSKAQLDDFRAQLRAKSEAAFLAPQLLEHAAILTRQLQIAIGALEMVRATAGELATAYEESVRSGTDCPHCHDAKLRAALTRLHVLLADG